MNALTDKRGALYPSTQSQKRTAASIPTVYVLAGWEGSAHDVTVLRDAIYNQGFCRTTYSLRVADHVSRMMRNMLVRWMSSC